MQIDSITDLMIQKNYSTNMVQKYTSLWRVLHNGQHVTYDLGATTDKRNATITIIDIHQKVLDLEAFFLTNKTQDTFTVTLSGGEEIFGLEVDYSSPIICQIDVAGFKRKNFTDSELVLNLRVNDISLLTFKTPTLTPSLSELVHGHSSNREIDYNRENQSNYTEGANVVYHNNETRTFKSKFVLTHEEFLAVKIHILNTRNATTVLPEMPTKPFGGDLTGPYNVKILDWSERRNGVIFWELEMEFALVP